MFLDLLLAGAELALLVYATLFQIQSTLVISNSKGLSETLRDIRTLDISDI